MTGNILNVEEEYKICTAQGLVKPKNEVDKELIISLVTRAKARLEKIKQDGDSFSKKSGDYSFTLTDHYEVLRMCIDAYLNFDQISISNHKCSNAYLCINHSDLAFDWKTLETMRILRNGVNYRGKKVVKDQWDQLKLPFKVYIQSLQKMVKEKLEE